jgi:hypothetical protein
MALQDQPEQQVLPGLREQLDHQVQQVQLVLPVLLVLANIMFKLHRPHPLERPLAKDGII